jgi:hypothetical protein
VVEALATDAADDALDERAAAATAATQRHM